MHRGIRRGAVLRLRRRLRPVGFALVVLVPTVVAGAMTGHWLPVVVVALLGATRVVGSRAGLVAKTYTFTIFRHGDFER
ncbi:hypothetical protein ABZV93_28330 [Actinopolymorpha sp. NPDC004070]|uniref:hypothetical protein n=1 Tax=Actinopolymorpha sp. NPDC004070 TaxID=3154548 RepID=UPI0033A41778